MYYKKKKKSTIFTEIVGRRVHPHILRESRATNIVVYEHKSAEVAQKLLGHVDVSTTKNHYIIKPDEDDESDERQNSLSDYRH